MKSTAARISSFDALVAPPRAGIIFLPFITLLERVSLPSFMCSDQAVLSPVLGAPAMPAVWHALHTVL